MFQKRQITYNGIRVDIVEARADASHDVQISVLGELAFTHKPFKEYRDSELEGQGWKKLALVNGSLFFNEGSNTYANGIEKSIGVINENDDVSWDNNLGFYHENGVPNIYKQSYIKSIIKNSNVRGAITAAFGLINNGSLDISGAYTGQPSRSIYLKKSGRTIIGKRADNTIVFAVFDGVTGVSGLTGYETYKLAKYTLLLRNAVCMDGGGSTYGEYLGKTFNDSSREGPNAVAIYYRDNAVDIPCIKAGSKVSISSLTVGEVRDGKAYLNELNAWVDLSSLVEI